MTQSNERDLLINKVGRKYFLPISIILIICGLGVLTGAILALWLPYMIGVKVAVTSALLFIAVFYLSLYVKDYVARQVDEIIKQRELTNDMFNNMIKSVFSKLKDGFSGSSSFENGSISMHIMGMDKNGEIFEPFPKQIDNIDPETINDLNDLKDMLAKAEKEEKFELAKTIADRIKKIQKL